MAEDDKVYEEYESDFDLRGGDRKEVREKIIGLFLSEKAGYWKDGKKHVTRYKYYVETLEDGRRIYLYRPTYLNKGIDFQVWVEKFDGIKAKKPSHKDIFNDLEGKRGKDTSKLKELLNAITLVYDCQEPTSVLHKYPNLQFEGGMSTEMLLKILKWLFIEQDITYWNYDGRNMLFSAIKKAINEE